MSISLYFVIFRRPAPHSKIMLDFGNLKEQVNTILVRVNHHHILLTIKMSEEAINLRITQHIKIPKVISLLILGLGEFNSLICLIIVIKHSEINKVI